MPDSDLERVLRTCDEWPVPHVSAGITDSRETLALHGDPHVVYRLASLSKVITAWTCLVAVEEGSISLDDPLGPSGSTVRHCLAHAAGYGFDGDQPITGVGRRRIYSNSGVEMAVHHLETSTGIDFFDPNPWGLGIEIRGSKHPHWMGTRTSPHTVGHFGGAGTMFWIDPTLDLGLVALTDRPFDEWATDAVARWSELSDCVIDTVTSRSS